VFIKQQSLINGTTSPSNVSCPSLNPNPMFKEKEKSPIIIQIVTSSLKFTFARKANMM
jgi:hypothetical protein